jgi:alpha-acetolactate decarboxylase
MHRSNVMARFLGLMIFLGCHPADRHLENASGPEVHVIGAMKDVMRKGELHGTIDLDTVSNKQHLYGLGPVEYLSGEILVLDGKAYKSSVLTDTTMNVEGTFKVKAPFFVYANVNMWNECRLPDSIESLLHLETYLDQLTNAAKRPFPFILTGIVETASIHVVNLPAGATVSSPQEAHEGQMTFQLTNERVDIVGFFSTEHKGIFTHHDTFMHVHLMTANRSKMGHLDNVHFKPGTMTLRLPAE